jgi:endonuclease/exonuclease/phosphatase family metal-dependent hydrolase
LPDGAWPDLLCLEEIENASVLEALASGPLKAAGYRHIGMAPAPGSPINSGILSRLPILSLKAHALAGSVAGAKPGRSLLEARIGLGSAPGSRGDGPGQEAALTVFVLHWKSRVEGAQATEAARREAAALLAGRVAALLEADPEAELLVCGDFNESPDEYLRVGREGGQEPKRLLVAREPEGAGWLLGAAGSRAGSRAGASLPSREPVLFSPWAADSGYSYQYKGERERLDGFLLSPGLLDGKGLSFRGFSAVDAPFLLGPEGEPLGWSSISCTGYSDHLPILLLLEGSLR